MPLATTWVDYKDGDGWHDAEDTFYQPKEYERGRNVSNILQFKLFIIIAYAGIELWLEITKF